MAKDSKVSPTLNPNISHDDNDEENDNDASFHKKGLMVLHALSKNENARANIFEIMNTLNERGLTIKAL